MGPHSLFHQGLPQSELSGPSGSGWEGLTDAALQRYVPHPESGSTIMLIADGKEARAGDAILKSGTLAIVLGIKRGSLQLGVCVLHHSRPHYVQLRFLTTG